MNRKGFTILEIMLSLALGLIIMAVLYQTFFVQRTTYSAIEQKTELR